MLSFRRSVLAGAGTGTGTGIGIGIGPVLGGRILGSLRGQPLASNGSIGTAPALALLAPLQPVLDAWLGADAATATAAPALHAHGCVRWASDGDWLHGWAELDDATFDGGLQAAAQQAYADLFDVLAASASPHLLRLWNHFCDMNQSTGGVERYLQFNSGRQQAFTAAARSAFDGAPAACAIGTASGPLQVYFLAGRHAPQAIENPRQVSAYRYPKRYGAHSPTFSRAALVEAGGGRELLLISGTASIVGHETVHVGDVRRQTAESLRNVRAVLAAASAVSAQARAPRAQDLVCTVYLRHAGDLAAVREVFERELGADSPAARSAVYLRADICRADLLVEIEAHGFANADAGEVGVGRRGAGSSDVFDSPDSLDSGGTA